MDEILKIQHKGLYMEVPPDNVEAMKQVKSLIEHLIEEGHKEKD